MRVASRVAERRKTWDLRKLGNFKEIPEMLRIPHGIYMPLIPWHPKEPKMLQ